MPGNVDQIRLRVLYTTLRTHGEAEVTPEATGNYLTQPPGPDCPHLPPPPSDDQYLLMLPALRLTVCVDGYVRARDSVE